MNWVAQRGEGGHDLGGTEEGTLNVTSDITEGDRE